MLDARPGSLRAPCSPEAASHQPRLLRSRRRIGRGSLQNSRCVIPRLEPLEDRSLLSGASPGAYVLNAQGIHPADSNGLPYGFSPAQIRQAYGFDQISFMNGSVAADGSGQTIAIIDAYNQPDIAGDLAAFDATYGIPAPPVFTEVNEYGGASLPAASPSWGLEISLDVEWSHAIAPGANILLVEANSSSWADLLTAVNFARNQPGVSVVSMSFGGGEWSGESAFDPYFTTPAGHAGISFIASSGDSGSTGAPEVPSVSPNVLAVGGTQLFTDASGNYLGEVGWSGSGGGVSLYEPRPAYQNAVVPQNISRRAVPDVSYDASPNSPFAVYDTTYYSGWIEVYGTSAGAPQWAALVAIADQGRALVEMPTLDGPTQLLPAIYSLPAADFHDVLGGNNGGYAAGPGYDLVTGRGSPLANAVVAALAGPAVAPANPTQTSLASNVNPTLYGQSVIFTAEVFATGGGTLTGTVAFLANGVVLGEGALNHGTAAFTTAGLPPGGYDVTAVYSGDASHQGSASYPLVQLVSATSTTVNVSSSANPASDGQAVTFTALVQPVAPGRGTPTGIVYFLFGGTSVAVAILQDGVATFTTSSLGAGSTDVVAVYSGDGDFIGSTSGTLTQSITPQAGGPSSSGSPPDASGPSRATSSPPDTSTRQANRTTGSSVNSASPGSRIDELARISAVALPTRQSFEETRPPQAAATRVSETVSPTTVVRGVAGSVLRGSMTFPASDAKVDESEATGAAALWSFFDSDALVDGVWADFGSAPAGYRVADFLA